MASLRNAVFRKEHLERSQPANRKKYGLLEKHKDYVKRAKNFNFKEKRISALKLKAALKNPDEFYYNMNSATTVKGKHKKLGYSNIVDKDVDKLVKTQDLTYALGKRVSERTKIEKLESSLNFLSNSNSTNKHTLFVDTVEECNSFKPEEHFDTVPELINRKFNRPRVETLRTQEVIGPKDQASLRKLRRKRDLSYRELSARMDREKKIDRVVAHLTVQKNLLGKGKRKKVKDAEGDEPAQYVWKKQRKH